MGGSQPVLCAVNSYRYFCTAADSPETATGPHERENYRRGKWPGREFPAGRIQRHEGCTKLTREVRIIAGEEQVQITNIAPDKVATRAKEGIHFGFAFNVPGQPQTHVDIPWGVDAARCRPASGGQP